MLRSHAAGSLRATDAGQKVTLAGWVARRRDHGGVIFIDLRDASGVSQVVFREAGVLESAHRLRAEFCIAVDGVVEIRPEGNANPEIATGEIEVNATSLTVLGESAPLPFQLDETRRRGGAAEVPLPRSAARGSRRGNPVALQGECGRPRGAGRPRLRRDRDADADPVDSRGRSRLPGARPPAARSFYALPQSPQLFKQLLMVAGMERYYQIARCYRDEDFRADRQPEFTQLDMEMSFVDADDVIAVSEEILTALWALIGYELPTPMPRITLRRGDAPVRLRQARPAVRPRARRVHGVLLRHPVPGVPGALCRCGGDAGRRVAAAAHAGRLAGVRQAARPQGAGVCAGRRGRHARRAGRQEPDRRRARRPGRARRRQAGGLRLLLGGPGEDVTRAAGRGPHRDRQATRHDRPRRVGVRLGRRLAAVRARRRGDRRRRRRGRLGRVDRGAPRVHRAQAGVGGHASTPTRASRWPTPTTSSATATRSAAARSVSIAATSRSGCSR